MPVSVLTALLLTAVVALLALAVGGILGIVITPRLAEHRRRRSVDQDGITVSEMLQRIVSLAPVGIVVVDTYRDVVYTNDRAHELGLVRDRLLDDRAWTAALVLIIIVMVLNLLARVIARLFAPKGSR